MLKRPIVLIGATILVLCALALALVLSEWLSALPVDAKAHFVGGASCIDCHQEQYDLFVGSHHDLAMDVANDETVLAKFDGTQIEHFGITSTVFKDGDRFMVNTQGPDGEMQDFEVTMVFGYEPIQQYMVELKPSREKEGHGQYQVLRLTWDVPNQQWFYLSPPDVYEQIHPNDPLHWTGITQRWNTSCASCHSTDLKKNYDALTRSYSTMFVDIDVNCEACHGPGSLHVQIAEKRRFFWDRNHGMGLTTNLKSPDNFVQVEACAPCHSRRTQIKAGDLEGRRFDELFSCQLLSERTYHDDGQIRDEDYVYGSFIQSKMYHQGIKCTDCHDPHSAKVKFTDNQLCTSCHQHPAGKYDTPAHHRHKVGSKGALCVECHMPATTYMAVDPRRDHSLRVPRPDLSVEFGTPNACTACHVDESLLPEASQAKLTQYLDWIIAAENGDETIATELKRVNQLMADAFKQWYPEAATKPDRSRYYEQLVIGKSGKSDSIPTLRKLAVDPKAPAIFRASSAQELGIQDQESLETLVECMSDNEPKVIASAVRASAPQVLRVFEDPTIEKVLMPTLVKLMGHQSNLVRIEVARSCIVLPKQYLFSKLTPDQRQEFEKAIEDLKASITFHPDLAMSHMVMASIHQFNGDISSVESSYRDAITVQPRVSGPRTNLAALLEGRIDSLTRRAANGESGLAREVGQLQQNVQRYRNEENELLKFEVERSIGIQGADGLHYRYGLSCYLNGDLDEAEKWLISAYEQQPDVENYVLALATFYDERNQFSKAIEYVRRLLELSPDNAGYKQLRDSLLAKLKTLGDKQ